ncbi:MAG: hypothetical protein COZ98_05720 [Candidatus Omnitrophica bacterium CG_4_8_14_3_um_filter_43_15]|nr:MAG: hypothetical protein AUJ89_04345 [Candidatus Omnitrophica bacterium CG1_02_43_210]PIV39581.1 MAG: hypothetical protein COS29_01785 [Candidatus Omnitrophica bacterium CG02_land_8_20_14_3_00__42_8]PIW79792.1 MAG: hypothetical protein COZ98_05720 [Candidatus Omnitrophica bacterium CG_4_8_14_3_um_filter_43_15]
MGEAVLKNCRFCESGKIRRVFKREDIYIFRCLDCGTVFLGNDLNEEAIKALYEYYGHSTYSDEISPITKLRYEEILDDFEKYRKNNRIIDIGCGAGDFMLSAANRGWQADGTEIAEEAIKLAASKGLEVIEGDAAFLELDKDRYDIATLSGVMEHVSDPEAIVSKIEHIVRPGGIIYITTPNYNDITRIILGKRWGVFHKEHLFYFTAGNLASLLKKHNFKIKKARTESLMLREILRIFKKGRPLDDAGICQRQEEARGLIEKSVVFSALKGVINFILNIFRVGGTIYITAEKV